MRFHYTEKYLMTPPHKVTVDLVGLGGTGSQVLSNLGRMNQALMSLGHPGLHVRCFDDDIVTQANIGRQLFSTSDVGLNKAVVLTTRVNRFFGYEWESRPEPFTGQSASNITITCVDSAKARVMIGYRIEGMKRRKNAPPTDNRYYWLDFGNDQKTGQVVLGTLVNIKQPRSEIRTRGSLPSIIKKIPQIKKMVDKKNDDGPSCSLAEALTKQDLFINSTLAQFGCNLIWKLFREGMIRFHGCYLNLETFIVNPIKIK